MAAWLASSGYCGRTALRGATGDDGAAQAHVTRALVAVLTCLAAQIKTLAAHIAEQLARHADAHIFTSLPRAGTVRAARLLAEMATAAIASPTPPR
jgi:transposase